MPETRLPIDLQGQLTLDGPSGRTLRLQARGSRLLLVSPGWPELRKLGPRSMMGRRKSLAATIRSLRALDLSLHVEVDGRRAAAFGAGAKTSLVARLLRLKSADIRFSTVVRFLAS